ncbi:ferritin family protein [Leptospira sp. FAT2]|uniref:ferritin-like domain-containing protein n=1 Tax=Leptospira sanjuanensis TaxID=2879643 RepID=UPI001EE8DFAC|nr:ferritin family protein [Leptospira sanjuanensis]MCG6170002.1 ferritin family protein [Leptospira sanjuanensis]MCG6195339.1 ferritin family protein [Leptospira sanjuanensis]
MNIKPLKETTFLEAVAAAIQHEKDYFEFYMSTYEKLPPGDTKELFERLAEEVDDHIKFITELYEQAEGSELPNLKQLTAIHKFHETTLQKLMNKVERTISGPGTKDAHEALELAIREAENSVSFYEKLANKFDDVNIKSLFTKLKDYNHNYQSLLETELNGLDQSGSGQQGTFFWDEQAEEVAKAESKPSKAPSVPKKPKAAAPTSKPAPAAKPAPVAKSTPAVKPVASTASAKKAAPAPKKAASKSKPVAKKAAPKKKAAVKKAAAKPKKTAKKTVKKAAPKKKAAAKAKKKR